MGLRNETGSGKIKRTLAWYNMLPNLIWSVLNLLPVSIFCFTRASHKWVYIFLGISLIPVFLRNSFLDRLQIGKTDRIYKKLGVPIVNRFAQNGTLVNRFIKKKFPDHKIVSAKKSSISGLINQTYVFEKFHLILFVFFDLIIVYAMYDGYFSWACIFLLNNIAYNIYPNLLQQYIRLKLKLFHRAKTPL